MVTKSGSEIGEELPLPTGEELLIAALDLHGQLKRSDDADTKLDPGQTHLLIEREGEKPTLLEKRKSFFGL